MYQRKTAANIHNNIYILLSRSANSIDSFDSLTIHSCQPSLWISSVYTELVKVRFCWSTNTGVSMYKSSEENVANDLVFNSLAVPSLFVLLGIGWLMRGEVCGHTVVVL